MYYSGYYLSPVGKILIVCTNEAVTGLWIDGQKHFAAGINDTAKHDENHRLILKTKEWLGRYFNGEKPQTADLPLAPQGTQFQQCVWKLLCEIPYGQTVTYGELAKKTAAILGKEKMSAQAIGGAVGRNPISVIIPCHRVIGADGSLTGYDGGIDKKMFLLKLESE